MSISCKHENSLIRSIKKNRSLLVIHFKYSSVCMTFPKSLAHGTLLNAMCRLVGKGVWGESGYMCACVWLILFVVHLKLPQHC